MAGKMKFLFLQQRYERTLEPNSSDSDENRQVNSTTNGFDMYQEELCITPIIHFCSSLCKAWDAAIFVLKPKIFLKQKG